MREIFIFGISGSRAHAGHIDECGEAECDKGRDVSEDHNHVHGISPQPQWSPPHHGLAVKRHIGQMNVAFASIESWGRGGIYYH